MLGLAARSVLVDGVWPPPAATCNLPLADHSCKPARSTGYGWEIEGVARLQWRGLHERQLSHRDLKAGNILAAEDRIWLIDLVGMRVFMQLSREERIQNLTRLNASFHAHPLLTRTDKLRFLRTYQNWGLHSSGRWKKWWKAIDKATLAKVARNRSRGRPLA